MMTITTKSPLESKILDLAPFIGKTPLFEVKNLNKNPRVRVLAKLEWYQLGGSVKARPAYEIVKNAIISNRLSSGTHLLDASSGNTAIAYAAIGAAIGIPVTICLPENASDERKRILKAFGANIIATSRFGTTDEAQEKALELSQNDPEKYFYADQYNNLNNWKAHYNHTAIEIIDQTESQVTHFVSGLGTTGTFTGTTTRLKEAQPSIQAISLQPDEALHGLEGWKHLDTAKIPGIYNLKLADENRSVNTYEAFGLIPEIAKKEGLLVSPSAAANLLGALEVANQIDEGTVITVFPDNAEKYSEVMKNLF